MQDVENPVAQCRDVVAQLDNEGNVVVFARNPGNGEVFIDGGSTDNSLDSIIIEVSRDGTTYGPSVSFDCSDVGSNVVNLRVTDQSGNSSLCIAAVEVENFFKDFVINLNLPEICLDPFQDTINLRLMLLLTCQTERVFRHRLFRPWEMRCLGNFTLSSFSRSQRTFR